MNLRAIFFADPLVVLDTVVMGTLSLVAGLFDKTGNTQHRIARLWARFILLVSGIKVRVEGLEKLDPSRGYVLVANHLSLTDTPVVMSHIPLQFRFFAKEELFRIPFMGTHLRRAGHFSIARDDPRAGIRTMNEGARAIREHGISVLVFPEGGRTMGKLEEFREGAAYLAIKAGVPAVPVGIQGTLESLPMGSLMVKPARVMLRIGDPIPTASMRPRDHGKLTQMLHQRVAELTGQSAPVQCK